MSNSAARWLARCWKSRRVRREAGIDRDVVPGMRKSRVLFVCLGNACRSIMAEALARHFAVECMEARSAGLSPLGSIPPFTLEALEEAGISTAGLYSKPLSEVRLQEIDYLVDLTMRHAAKRMVPNFSGKMISYPVTDPFGRDLETYRRVREHLASFVGEELPRFVRKDQKFWWLHPKRLLVSLRSA